MNKKNVFRIGSRASPLALAQAHEVQARLIETYRLSEENFPISPISTSGDKAIRHDPAQITRKGLFTKEIEEALLEKRIDIAVHSSKDMPAILPQGLQIAAFLEREDARDAFIGRTASCIKDLRPDAIIGSSSLRRKALLKALRPDIQTILFRGNVDTRIRKLDRGDVDGIIIALAGLKRLNLASRVTEIMSLETFPPAPGQGAICIECRKEDEETLKRLSGINHKNTQSVIACERSFLISLDGSCLTPIAGYARIKKDQLIFSGQLILSNGKSYKAESSGPIEKASDIGQMAAKNIKETLGPEFFQQWHKI